MHLRLSTYKSPLSSILLVTDETGALRALDFVGYESRMNRLLREHYGDYTLTEGPPPRRVVKDLEAYFAGDTNALDRIPTATGGTPFQRAVWRRCGRSSRELPERMVRSRRRYEGQRQAVRSGRRTGLTRSR